MPELKKVIGFLLFFTLMLVKVSAFHVYAHDDTEADGIENCDVCDLAIENQGSEIQFSIEVPTIEPPELLPNALEIRLEQQLETGYFNFPLFSRPPPHYLA